jgi:hypothetical protein
MPPFREVPQQSSRPPKYPGEQWVHYNFDSQPKPIKKPIEKPREEFDLFWQNFAGDQEQKELGMRLHDEWLKHMHEQQLQPWNQPPVALDAETSTRIQTAVEKMINANNNEKPRPIALMIEGSPLHKYVQMYSREAKNKSLKNLSDELKAQSKAAMTIYDHLRHVIRKTTPRPTKEIGNNTTPRSTKEIGNNTPPRPTKEIGNNTAETGHYENMPLPGDQQERWTKKIEPYTLQIERLRQHPQDIDSKEQQFPLVGAHTLEEIIQFHTSLKAPMPQNLDPRWNQNDAPPALQPKNEGDLRFGPMPFQMLTAEYQPPVPLSEHTSAFMNVDFMKDDSWNESIPTNTSPEFAGPIPGPSGETTAFSHTAPLSEDTTFMSEDTTFMNADFMKDDFWRGSMPEFAETMYGPSGTEPQAFDHPASLYNTRPDNTWSDNTWSDNTWSDEFGQ